MNFARPITSEYTIFVVFQYRSMMAFVGRSRQEILLARSLKALR